MHELLQATDALARYDQVLKSLHNSEILLALAQPSSGYYNPNDEIMPYEADFSDSEHSAEVRSDIVETILYQRALKNAQAAMEDGCPFSKFMLKNHAQNHAPAAFVLRTRCRQITGCFQE